MVGAVFAVVVVAVSIVAVAVGLAWFIAVPVAVFLLLFPLAYLIALLTRPKGVSSGAPAAASNEDASYQPVSKLEQPGSAAR
jgi:hypothetical protein